MTAVGPDMALFLGDVCEDEKYVLNIQVEIVQSPHGGEKLVRTAEAQKEDRMKDRGKKRRGGGGQHAHCYR